MKWLHKNRTLAELFGPSDKWTPGAEALIAKGVAKGLIKRAPPTPEDEWFAKAQF